MLVTLATVGAMLPTRSCLTVLALKFANQAGLQVGAQVVVVRVAQAVDVSCSSTFLENHHDIIKSIFAGFGHHLRHGRSLCPGPGQ
jgi:hypothetical protein